MAFSDLCHISNAFKTVENEPDPSERIMEENSMVQDLITKILDETGSTDTINTVPPPEKNINNVPPTVNQYPNNEAPNSFMPSPPYNYNNNLYNFNQNDNGYNYNISNGFNTNGFVNYPDNDVNSMLAIEPVPDETVTPEQLNLLRLAAQEIGGAQFSNPNKYDEKYYNFFEPNQRNSLPESNMFNTFNRPNSLNLDMNFNSNFDGAYVQRYPNKYENGFMKDQTQDSSDLLGYMNQLNLTNERPREEPLLQNDFKSPMEMNSPYQNEEYNKLQEDRNKLLFNNRSYQQVPPKTFNGENNFYSNDLMVQMPDRNLAQNYDFSNQSNSNSMNFKMNGYHQQNDFVQRREVNPLLPRDGFQASNNVDRTNFDTIGRDNQQAMLRQQELARQMTLLMRNRPPPNPLNVDVTFLHENTPFNLGLGAIIGPSPPHVPPPVLASPVLDLPLLAPFYTMRNMRGAATSSSILHARLDACYEQWRQLERERKRTEARLALAYPGRAVSSSNSIPVPRLPPCPTRVDRLTVDMLREHTKVLTLMGKMETLRASVCVAQNKKPNRPEENKITVLKRGQDNVPAEKELDPMTFDPSSWKDDVKNLSEIAPHSEVESAMLAWRNAVAGVQAARRRELAPHHPHPRIVRPDPILQLAEAVKQLCESARRARCAMWCDLTLTVALAPHSNTAFNDNSPPLRKQTTSPKPSTSSPKPSTSQPKPSTSSPKPSTSSPKPSTSFSKPSTSPPKPSTSTKSSTSPQPSTSKQLTHENLPSTSGISKPQEHKEEKPGVDNNQPSTSASETKHDKQDEQKLNKQPEREKNNHRRPQNYRKVNQRNDFYQKNSRYDNRIGHHRHPYHYLATGPIN